MVGGTRTPSSSGAEEWHASLPRRLTQLIVAVCVATSLVVVLVDRNEWTHASLELVSPALVSCVAAGRALAAIRTRIRLTPDSVEVRVFRTRVYLYTDIRAVRLSGGGSFAALIAVNNAVQLLPSLVVRPRRKNSLTDQMVESIDDRLREHRSCAA